MPSQPTSKRVVITGMGWVTPLGDDLERVWQRLLAGECAISALQKFPGSAFATNFAAQVGGFDLARFLANTEPHAKAHDHVRYLLGAASQAWKQAGLGDASTPGALHSGCAHLDRTRMGVYLGSGEGTVDFENFAAANVGAYDAESRDIDGNAWARIAHERFDPRNEIEQEPSIAAQHLATAFQVEGPSFNAMTACAASTQAIGEAFQAIRAGDADAMLAGGSHTMIHALGMTGFIRLTAMSTRRDDPATASRPFSQSRDGFVMGEGAGVHVVESLDHALARGATPLAEIVGFGSTADAYRITDIDPDGLGAAYAMRAALQQAGVDPHATDDTGRPFVHYISAHGTGTQENDSIETRAVKEVFADLAPRVPFSSVKSMMGHLIQAAGAVELVTCVQAIRTASVPPTINLHDPDPACDLDYVANESRDLTDLGGVRMAMSNSFGFGGQNDTLLLKRYEP
ncbi:MAG: beta-ketoacyl-[acyl-carrier-protein] synthase family protein [Planctomycetota bacterium]